MLDKGTAQRLLDILRQWEVLADQAKRLARTAFSKNEEHTGERCKGMEAAYRQAAQQLKVLLTELGVVIPPQKRGLLGRK